MTIAALTMRNYNVLRAMTIEAIQSSCHLYKKVHHCYKEVGRIHEQGHAPLLQDNQTLMKLECTVGAGNARKKEVIVNKLGMERKPDIRRKVWEATV